MKQNELEALADKIAKRFCTPWYGASSERRLKQIILEALQSTSVLIENKSDKPVVLEDMPARAAVSDAELLKTVAKYFEGYSDPLLAKAYFEDVWRACKAYKATPESQGMPSEEMKAAFKVWVEKVLPFSNGDEEDYLIAEDAFEDGFASGMGLLKVNTQAPVCTIGNKEPKNEPIVPSGNKMPTSEEECQDCLDWQEIVMEFRAKLDSKGAAMPTREEFQDWWDNFETVDQGFIGQPDCDEVYDWLKAKMKC